MSRCSRAESRGSVSVSREILNIALGRQVRDEAENRRLFEVAKASTDADATGKALCANLIHIVRAAEEFQDTGPLSPDDLVSEGCILLVTAYIPRYDPSRGGSIRSFLRTSLRRDFVKIVSKSGQPGLSMPMGRLTLIAKRRREGGGGEAGEAGKDGAVVSADAADVDPPSPGPSPAEEAERGETLYELRLAMAMLDERERDVVRARFALPPFDDAETFVVIGRRWGISKERARQLEGAALAKLREALAALE